MKIVIFGANGATGRLLTGQALAGGHDVAAVTRRPADFPITHTRLTVVVADAGCAQSGGGRGFRCRAVDARDAFHASGGQHLQRRVCNIAHAMSQNGAKRWSW
jgi:putative NADH-flavin reductase